MSEQFYVGLDVGSSATKCAVLDAGGRLLGNHVVPSGFAYHDAIERALAQSLHQARGSQEDIVSRVSTGYGRKHVPKYDRVVTEITAHARGAREWHPDVRTIVDIGGQDTKIIQIDQAGQLIDYRMNAKCAAGTGTFLESTAVKLGMTLAELDELAMKSTNPTAVNSYCTVFAGTEVIERIKEGQKPEDIAMGLFRSIALRVKEMMSGRSGAVGATGGVVAHCQAMIDALNEALQCEILLAPLPQFAGAFGAALLALETCPRQGHEVDHAPAG
ncbi:MAG: acyl-CoA dehydratase activase [Planctomycetota bacterium]|jgi:predicted CoA-substrate-specific enzyme activase